jgi:hypothetical protein
MELPRMANLQAKLLSERQQRRLDRVLKATETRSERLLAKMAFQWMMSLEEIAATLKVTEKRAVELVEGLKAKVQQSQHAERVRIRAERLGLMSRLVPLSEGGGGSERAKRRIRVVRLKKSKARQNRRKASMGRRSNKRTLSTLEGAGTPAGAATAKVLVCESPSNESVGDRSLRSKPDRMPSERLIDAQSHAV